MKKEIELLAPAGSYEALVAAVQNGADAIYMGGTEFSARAYASNFSRERIKEAVEYAHIRGVKIYFAVNTLVKDSEINKLLEYINFLYNTDVDAVIVQDLGALKLIKELYPDFEIHCSTQMTLHNSYGVKLLKEFGAKRVVLARELSLEEIEEIKRNTRVELEVFVHGALCVSYSGQCLMSSFIGGRSGNRGKCAQPCRKKYELIDSNDQHKKGSPFYYMSMRDLNTLENISALINSGVTSFKIEGRMKKPQYVAAIVGAYRKAIDLYLSTGKELKDKEIQKKIAQVFNRKFTKGYLFSERNKQVINIDKPNNSGIYLGKVIAFNKALGRFTLSLEDDIVHGDGIEVWGKSEAGGTVNKIYKNNRLTHEAKKGETVEIELKGIIRTGDQVFKTLDSQLIKELEKTYEKDIENKKNSIKGNIKIEIGKPIELTLYDNLKNIVNLKSTSIVEKAQKVALTEEKLLTNLKKLNNTPFELETMDIDLKPECAVPLSVINELRRDAVNSLIELRRNRNKRKQQKIKGVDSEPIYKKINTNKEFKLSVKVEDLDQLKVVLQKKVDRIYFSDIDNISKALDLCRKSNCEIYLKTPNIIKDNEFKIYDSIIQNNRLDGILVGDLGMLKYLKENFSSLKIVTDMTLNIFNSYTVKQISELKVSGATLSQEMDLKSISNLNVDTDIEIECIVYGKTSVMTTEYCPLVNENVCDKKCNSCKQPKHKLNWSLKDEKDYSFPISRDALGRTVIYNSHPIFMGDKIESFMNSKVDGLRIDITNESSDSILSIMDIYNNKKYFDVDQLGFKYTRGHYFKDIE